RAGSRKRTQARAHRRGGRRDLRRLQHLSGRQGPALLGATPRLGLAPGASVAPVRLHRTRSEGGGVLAPVLPQGPGKYLGPVLLAPPPLGQHLAAHACVRARLPGTDAGRGHDVGRARILSGSRPRGVAPDVSGAIPRDESVHVVLPAELARRSAADGQLGGWSW